MKGTHVDAGVSRPGSRLLHLKNKRATIGKSSAKLVGQRVSSFAQGYGGQVAFIQDAHSIKDIMKSQGMPGFFIRHSLGVVGQALPPISKLIDAADAIDELPSYDSFEPVPEDF